MIRFPWWGSAALAVVAYTGLKHMLPAYIPEEHPLSGLIPLLAPIVGMTLLLLAGKQLYDGESGDNSHPDQDDDDDGDHEERRDDDR